MQKIEIHFNPYNQETHMWINGRQMDAMGHWGEILNSKEMDEWLNPSVKSYKKWAGFLPELIEYLNDDELEISFYGQEKDYRIFEKALLEQKHMVESYGYESDKYEIQFIEGFQIENIGRYLLRFVEDRLIFADTQDSKLNFKFAQQQLHDAEKYTLEQIRSIKSLLEHTIEEQIAACSSEKMQNEWIIARNQLNKIFSR